MKSAGGYIANVLDNGHYHKAIQLISQIDANQLLDILDEKLPGVDFSSRSGDNTVFQKILFDYNGTKVLPVIFDKFRNLNFLFLAIRYSFSIIEKELAYRSHSFFRDKLDEGDHDISHSIEMGLYVSLKSNLESMTQCVSRKSRAPVLHCMQGLLRHYYRSYLIDNIQDYSELFSAAFSQMHAELESGGINLDQAFRSNGAIHKYYAQHLVNQVKRDNPSCFRNMVFKTEFLQDVITQDMLNGAWSDFEVFGRINAAVEKIYRDRCFVDDVKMEREEMEYSMAR